MGEEHIKKDVWTGGRATIWRIRTNEELMVLYKDLAIVTEFKKKRLEWIGHVVRMDHRRTVKNISE